MARMLDVVRQMRSRPAEEIVTSLHRAACEFAGTTSLDDDMTAIVIKALPRRSRPRRDEAHRLPG